MAGRCTATGRFARPAIQVFARTRFRRSKHIGGLGPTPHLVGQAPHWRGTPSDRSGAANPSRRSAAGADAAVSGSSLRKQSQEALDQPEFVHHLSVEGCKVSPRKSRKKPACFSSTTTSMPRVRANSRASFRQTCTDDATTYFHPDRYMAPALPPRPAPPNDLGVHRSIVCSSRYSFTGRTGLPSDIKVLTR